MKSPKAVLIAVVVALVIVVLAWASWELKGTPAYRREAAKAYVAYSAALDRHDAAGMESASEAFRLAVGSLPDSEQSEWNGKMLALVRDSEIIPGNEALAPASLRNLSNALSLYHSRYSGYPEELDWLGSGSEPASPRRVGRHAGLIDSSFAAGKLSGYVVTYQPGSRVRGRIESYEVSARPAKFGETGRRSFYMDSNGTITSASDDRPASPQDPPL